MAKEPDRFVEDEELVGRTVAKVMRPDGPYSRSVLIVFEDGTYTHLEIDHGYYEGEEHLEFHPLPPERLYLLDRK